MAPKTKQIKMSFSKDKDTKTMVRYAQDGDHERPVMLYLPKSDLEKIGTPDEISVVVTAA